MDAKEALQYVYCVCLAADQGDGVGKETLESAWELVRRIIVLAHSGPAWDELVGGFRSDGTKFVCFTVCCYILDLREFRVVSSNKVLRRYTYRVPPSTMSRSSSERHVNVKRTIVSLRPSNCTISQATMPPSSHASHRLLEIRYRYLQPRMKKAK